MRYDYRVPFIDRENELGVLEKVLGRDGFGLVVVFGRRRVGKTRLLREFLGRHSGAYFMASELTYPQLCREFVRVVADSFGFVPRGEDFIDVLEELGSRVEGALVVVDEFQYLVEADPTLPSRLQRSIDGVLGGSDLKLFLSGSAVSFFERELLGYRAPLYGRRTASVRLKPIRFINSLGFLKTLGYEDAVRAYSMLGGTPAYLTYAYGANDLREVVERVVEPGSPLLDEVEGLLRQELREPMRYMALLKALAEGRSNPYEAATAAGLDPRTIHKYLQVLQELDIVDVRKPLGFRRGARVFFRDNYFRFWFSRVQPVRHLIEAGGVEEAINAVLRHIDEFTGPAFQEIVTESIPELIKHKAITTEPLQSGPWWHKGEEIDLVIRDPGNRASFIEVKWGRVSQREAKIVLNRLRQKARKTGLQEGRNEFILVAGSTDWFDNVLTELSGLGKVVNYKAIYEDVRK